MGKNVAGRYRVVQLLGSGGMGHVYLAEERAAGKAPSRVALKVLRAEHRSRPDLVRRFEREAIAAAELRHPSVLEVRSAPIDDDGVLCFAMELLVGLDLADTLAYRRTLGGARAARIACGVAEGLAAAHAAGIIHRDVKPENVFLVHAADGREMVKILDFGFAWMPGDDAAEGDRAPAAGLGTPEYTAPEQDQGAPAHPTADIYSLGIVLYEMLAGKVPFSGAYPAVARHHASRPPPPMRGPGLEIPDDLEAVVKRAIAKDPAARFASMDELRHALLAVLASDPARGPAEPASAAEGAATPGDPDGGHQA